MTLTQSKSLHLGIDAFNIRGGGGETHLIELLRAAQPQEYGFDKVTIWSGESILQRLEERPWLRKIHDPLLNKPLPLRMYWQQFALDNLVHRESCDVFFVPGGTYRGFFKLVIVMSQNLLPFEWLEMRRYGVSWMLLKLLVLRYTQKQTLCQANGVIFLTDHARNVVMRTVKEIQGQTITIPHGVNRRFDRPPRAYDKINAATQKNFRILYVSTVTVYKHQWHVAEAVATLREAGVPVQLELIGPAYGPSLKRLQKVITRLDPDNEFIHYRGAIPYEDLDREYQNADAFVFASTCESFGQIVTEAMTAGLPIACSNTGTMRELLGENALYFNAEHPAEITEAIRKMIENPALRRRMAWGAYERAKVFTWERCAHETFSFIAQVAKENMQ